MRAYLHSIKTPSTLTLIMSEGGPVSIPSSNPLYQQIENLITAGKHDEIAKLLDQPLAPVINTGKFKVEGGLVVIGTPLPKVLSDRILQFVEAEIDTASLERFWENCQKNPNPASVSELWEFLEHNHLPVTSDGCFIGYKAVGLNYLDIHSKTYENKPGNIVRMLRDKVDQDRRNECSTGFHVGGHKYASEFGGGPAQSRMMEVKVNPAHVVAVPRDSQYGKMRVHQYEIVRENPEFRKLTEQTYSGKRETQKKTVITKNAKSSIRRLPAALKKVAVDQTGGISIPLEILGRLFEKGQKVYAVIANARTRSITLVADKPKKAMVVKDVKVGDNTRIYSSLFASAQIQGQAIYDLAITNGTLQIS